MRETADPEIGLSFFVEAIFTNTQNLTAFAISLFRVPGKTNTQYLRAFAIGPFSKNTLFLI